MFVVTGGGSGIGRALAENLARRGLSVLIIGRREKALVETASVSERIDYLSADVSNHSGRQLIVERLKKVAVISGLVHNAGVIEPMVPMGSIDEASWRRVMATNVEAPLFLTQALQSQLAYGRVLHIGSGAAYFPVVGWSAYCTSKAALSMLNRCWQVECQQMAVTSVMPGIIDTEMQEKIRKASNMDPAKLEFFKGLHQQSQLLSPETVALFLSWLLLDISEEQYVSQEWDIYDPSHHREWLVSPHIVPKWE